MIPQRVVRVNVYLLQYHVYASYVYSDLGADKEELADRRISETNVVLRGCTLGLLGYPLDIDLMPVELGSFDVIIDEVLIIRGDDCDSG
ncbi:hypothetical protein Tco_1140438, partial [Tanacetum coccineum]